MALDALEAEKLVSDLWPEWLEAREKSKAWERWSLGRQELPVIPDTATLEYRSLQQKAITPWLGLIVQGLAQALIVEGYRTAGGDDDNPLWSAWQANNMDAKQTAIYEAAFTTGISYVAVLPTGMPNARSMPEIDGAPMPEWRPYSSSEMSAFYESAYDDWPAYALAAEPVPKWRQQTGSRKGGWNVSFFDEDTVYILQVEPTDERTALGTPRWSAMLTDMRPHGMGVVPVVRYVNRQTTTGRALGEVEPYTAVASRIDQDVFDRLVVQRFGSWRVRTVTGLETPPDQTEEVSLKVSDILTGGPGAQFGSLPETPLDAHLRAPIEDVRMLSAVSQTPPTHLTGDLTNISAEALAAIEAAHNRKVEQRKVNFGEAHERCFDLTARLLDVELDPAAQIRWRDMESRSMAQVADAFGKFAQMLEIPVEVLWDKIGFLSDQDRARALELRAQNDSAINALVRELSTGATSPTEQEPQQDEPGVPVVPGAAA